MNPETLDRFEQSLHCAFSGRHRPEDAAVFYLGALQAIEAAAIEVSAASPEAVKELAMLAEVLGDRARQATAQFTKLPWWKKIIRRV